MEDNEFILFDRIEKIKQTINKYGEDNFYISFSGGKDSVVLSNLIDLALPGNQIPRVFANTGIEYNEIVNFVKNLNRTDKRIVIIKPSIPIKKMLETEGYPFKSKEHSAVVNSWQNGNKDGKWVKNYLAKTGRFACPAKLFYQFTENCDLKISDKCCDKLKKEPLHNWQKENNKPYGIVGIMRSEGGRRNDAKCLSFSGKNLKNFQPLVPITKDWEEWFIRKYSIKLCKLYYPPYNFTRTGCKGCPFNKNLQKDLRILEVYFPNEAKQCEIIWKPVYDEYRKLNFRLKKENQLRFRFLLDDADNTITAQQ